jgi:hypothetical protein
MIGCRLPHPRMTGQDRRRFAGRTLAGTTGTGFARRPAGALPCPRGHVHSESIV